MGLCELREKMTSVKANIGKIDEVTLYRLINRELAKLGIDTRNWVDKRVVSDSYPKKKVGMFYYAEDKSFSEQLLSGKRVSGVVGYVDETGQHGLIVTLHQKVGEWANEHTYDADDYYVPQCAASKQRSCIVWYIFQQKTKNLHDVRCTDSSVICYNYSENGIRQGEAFLGNKEEMSLICQNRYQINQALLLIPGAELLHPSYYWTGSLNFLEKDEECLCKAYAWVLNFNNGMSYSCNIEYYAYILPLLEF